MTEVWYDYSYPEKRCGNCKYRQYDNGVYDENVCTHQPPPDGLAGIRNVIFLHGCCDYWEDEI